MILRSIQLENFGLFADRVDINLDPRQNHATSRPIVLVGGKNGAGKTTILEAVRLALYGRRALGVRVAQSEYEEYLRAMVHRNSASRGAAVGLEFDYSEAGQVHRFRVRRYWTVRAKSVVEDLVLDKNGTLMDSVPREEWHSFLQELIPPGVSQLFFFDGEKIREIADEDDQNEQLADAIRGLLGIELVTNLKTDVGLFIAKEQRSEETQVGDRLENAIEQIDRVEQQVVTLADLVAEMTATRDSQVRAADHLRRRYISEGGDAAAIRGQLEGERGEVRRQIAAAEHEFRSAANTLLPFALAPKLTSSFLRALSEKTRIFDKQPAVRDLQAAVRQWKTRGSEYPKPSATWNEKHWADLNKFIVKWAKVTAEQNDCPAFREITDSARAQALLNEIRNSLPSRVVALRKRLDALVHRSSELDAAITRADNADAGVLLDELRHADQLVGSSEQALKAKQEELKELKVQLAALQRERDHLLKEQAKGIASANRLALAGKVAQALEEFEARLLEHKLGQLRREFVDRFNYLSRKGGFISDITINPITFASILIDQSGRELHKSALSAGEKQIYAIAMLWALASTSGRPLPMIIDTPLARLDSEHRLNLIERYFPNASHQVILLSTDTEVDNSLMELLGPNVARSYRLDFQQDDQRTVVSEGYFEPVVRVGRGQRAVQ